MTKDEALKLALESLENSVDLVVEDAYNAEQLYGNMPTRQGKVNGLKVLADEHQKAITAIKEALALPQRTWVGLTDRDVDGLVEQYWDNDNMTVRSMMRAIEAKLKEKNT